LFAFAFGAHVERILRHSNGSEASKNAEILFGKHVDTVKNANLRSANEVWMEGWIEILSRGYGLSFYTTRDHGFSTRLPYV